MKSPIEFNLVVELVEDTIQKNYNIKINISFFEAKMNRDKKLSFI